MSRYVHTDNPQRGPGQAKCNQEHYHYLRAAVTRSFELVTEAPDPANPVQMFPRQGLSFARYPAYTLKPLHGMKLRLREDGRMHPDEIQIYKDYLFLGWKSREGGIMYTAVGQEFWGMILNYHSPARTTGLRAWDTLLNQWKEADYPQSMLPCMVDHLRASGSS